MSLKEQYKQKIDVLSSKSFNQDQKDLAKKMIDAAPEKEVQDWFQLIIQKVKLGFTFDSAPEVFQGAISLVHENKELGINLDKEGVNEHKLIIGENYDALKNLLLVYRNKVNVIYIDPPYNTEKTKEDGNHLGVDADIKAKAFIYRDKFSRTGWLNMMNERLKLAKQLLSDDGVIFVSIDDNEQAYLKVLMDEVFGEENFVASIIFDKTAQGTTLSESFKRTHEYIVCFQRSSEFDLNHEKIKDESKYNLQDEIGRYTISNKLNSINSYLPDNRTRGYTIYFSEDLNEIETRHEYNQETLVYDENYDIELLRKGFVPIRPGMRNGMQTVWNWSVDRLLKDWKKEIVFKRNTNGNVFPYHKNRETSTRNPLTIQTFDSRKDGNGALKQIFGTVPFDYVKPISLIKWVIDRSKNKNSFILDFFAGSGTTGQAVMELNEEDGGNRQFILVTNNENNIATNVTRERLLRVITGKGSNGETFEWKYSKDKPYLENNKVKIYETKTHKVDLGQDVNKLIETAKQELKNLDSSYDQDSEINVAYDLNSLHPLEEE